MDFFQAFIISLVEGLTEFLPISSTAHMTFVGPMVGIDGEAPFSQMFEVVIQLAAILAVVVIYYKKFFDFKNKHFYFKIILAVIPSLIAGYFLKKHIDAALGNISFIAYVMVAGGIVLLFIDRIFNHPRFDKEESVDYKHSFIIGCGQVLAIVFPGLSRSAATIITGMSQKLTRHEAAEFSFFLAVPTMFAASAKSFFDTYTDHPELLGTQNLTVLLFGSAVSFLVALAAIKFFIGFLKKYGFFVWGVYRIIIGVLILLLIHYGVLAK